MYRLKIVIRFVYKSSSDFQVFVVVALKNGSVKPVFGCDMSFLLFFFPCLPFFFFSLRQNEQ